MALSDTTLRAAQMLTSMSGTSGNPLEALLAYFEPILSDHSGEIYDPGTFAASVRMAYGWHFTEDVADGFRKRFVGKGWLTPKLSDRGLPLFDEGKPIHLISYTGSGSFGDLPDKRPIDATVNRIVTAFRQFVSEIGIDSEHLSSH